MMRDDENRNQEELERIDALISAAMDDELDEAARAELSRLIAEEESVAERVRQFHRIDGSLRGLAAAPDLEDRLATRFESLNARLESLDDASISESGKVVSLRGRALPLLTAAAAALAVYFFATQSSWLESTGDAPLEAPPETQIATEEGLPKPAVPSETEFDEAMPDAGLAVTEESLVWALGYADGPETELFSADLIEDFEVIEQLDLLEFMHAQDAAIRPRAGRG